MVKCFEQLLYKHAENTSERGREKIKEQLWQRVVVYDLGSVSTLMDKGRKIIC